MLINREKLLYCLEALEHSTKSARPMVSGVLSQCAIFNDTVVYTNNGNLKVECKFDTNIKAAVKLDKFISFIRSVNIDEIDIELVRSSLKVKAGDINATFSIVDERDTSTADLTCDVNVYHGDNYEFIVAAKECSGIIRNKFIGTSASICGVIVDVNEGYCYSSDTFRIMRYKLNSEITKDKKVGFSIPTKFVDIMWKYKTEVEEIYTNKDKSLIQLKTKSGITFTSVLINKNIQDFSHYFKNDGPSFIIKHADLANVINRHKSINDASNAENTSGLGKIKGTMFKIDKGHMTLKTIYSNECIVDEDLQIENTGEEFCFALDASYLDTNLVKNGIQIYTKDLILKIANENKECLVLINKYE
jgi:hypothetical protein